MIKGVWQSQKGIRVFSCCVTILLSLSFFASPHRLQQSLAAKSAEQQHHKHQSQDNDHIQCLRCILVGLVNPKLPLLLVLGLVVIGRFSLAETISPKPVFVTTRSARAPPR
jgi:hypothetical protein